MQAAFALSVETYDEFGGSDVSGTGGLVARVIDEITADCHAGAIWFRLLGDYNTHKLCVC